MDTNAQLVSWFEANVLRILQGDGRCGGDILQIGNVFDGVAARGHQGTHSNDPHVKAAGRKQ